MTSKHKWVILYVPREFITEEMCELAITVNGLALEYIPKEFKTVKLCKLAVNAYKCAQKYVPKDLYNLVMEEPKEKIEI